MKLLCSARKALFGIELLVLPPFASVKMPRKSRARKYSQSYINDPCSLQNVVRKIETFAPKDLAESWDNVGLLVTPQLPKLIKKILLTNDLTENVLEEVIEIGADMVISYHPVIFPSLQTLNNDYWKERIIGTLLYKQIALYCPHTAWDCVEGGVNDWLAAAFESKNGSVEPLKRLNDGGSLKVVNAIFSDAGLADQAIRDINAVVSCNINSIIQRDGKICVNIFIDKEYLCLPHLRYALDVNISEQKKVPTRFNAGIGRRVLMNEPISLPLAVSLVKQHLGLVDVGVAVAVRQTEEKNITTIAVCAGSGASVLKGVEADLYLTGEMSHHEVLDAVHRGTHVILTRHSNSERGFLKIAAEQHLKSLMPEIEFVVSSADRDPLQTM